MSQEILHPGRGVVALLAGESHGGTRDLLGFVHVALGLPVLLQRHSPSKVHVADLTPELSRVQTEVVLEVILPLGDKIALTAGEADIIAGPWLVV